MIYSLYSIGDSFFFGDNFRNTNACDIVLLNDIKMQRVELYFCSINEFQYIINDINLNYVLVLYSKFFYRSQWETVIFTTHSWGYQENGNNLLHETYDEGSVVDPKLPIDISNHYYVYLN